MTSPLLAPRPEYPCEPGPCQNPRGAPARVKLI